MGPQVKSGAVGVARAVQQALGEAGTVVATLICGDNYIAEQTDQAVAELLGQLAAQQPDLLVAGPALQAGRYGVACGALCAAVQEHLKIPAVTGMHVENPGVDLYRRQVYIVRTSAEATRLLEEVRRMVALGLKLVRQAPLDTPAAEGYFARGMTHNVLSDYNAAQRATTMLLAKLAGRAFASEVPLTQFTPVTAPARLRNVRHAKIALVTDGGFVPQGNPDGIEPQAATRYGSYSIQGLQRFDPTRYDNVHRGYDTTYVKQDPHRLLPLDVARELEQEGELGTLHETIYSTTGVATTLANSERMGREIAAQLKAAGVEGVILTST
jgi:glycine reductase